MRPLYALGAASTILAVVALYMKFQASVSRPPPAVVERAAKGTFDVELTLTFAAAPDAFSLAGDAVLVRFRNRTLLASKEPVAAGAPIVIRDVQRIQSGRNEFYIHVTPAESDPSAADDFTIDAPPASGALARAVRVRVLRDGEPVGDETLWSAPGEPVEGTVTVTVDASPIHQEHSHEDG